MHYNDIKNILMHSNNTRRSFSYYNMTQEILLMQATTMKPRVFSMYILQLMIPNVVLMYYNNIRSIFDVSQ